MGHVRFLIAISAVWLVGLIAGGCGPQGKSEQFQNYSGLTSETSVLVDPNVENKLETSANGAVTPPSFEPAAVEPTNELSTKTVVPPAPTTETPGAEKNDDVLPEQSADVSSDSAVPSEKPVKSGGAAVAEGLDSAGVSPTVAVGSSDDRRPSDNPTGVAAPLTGANASSFADRSLPETAPSTPGTIELLIPDKTFRREKNSKAVRVSYDDIDLLKILNMEPVPTDAVEHFPDWLKSLDGKSIRIRGFMYPTFEASGLTSFTLARDNGICCFVRQPKIYDIIAVELASGVTSDYIADKPFDVEGTFRIHPEADEKELYRLYRIENARVLR